MLSKLKYQMFDMDDNILILPTKFHIEHKIDNIWIKKSLTSSEFREIRHLIGNGVYRYVDNNRMLSYYEFFDNEFNNKLLDDVIYSVNNKHFGPTWFNFIDCIINGNLFMIITARGHEPETIKAAIKWIIYNYLDGNQKEKLFLNLVEFNSIFKINSVNWSFDDYVDKYLSSCDFIGVSSNYFKERFNNNLSPESPEVGKEKAIKYFVDKVSNFGKVLDKDIDIEFSDDDLKIIKHVYKYIKNDLSKGYKFDFKVFYTKDGLIEFNSVLL